MITVVIRDDGEPNVIALTYENLWKELKDIPGAEIEIASDWMPMVKKTKNKFISFVEPDCLVNSGYFKSLTGFMNKKALYGRVGMFSSAIGVNNWANRFFGYQLGGTYTSGVLPVKEKKSNKPYPVQMGFVPGAVFRTDALKHVVGKIKYHDSWQENLVYLSNKISFGFWQQDIMVYINPNSTYVTTEDYANDIGKFDPKPEGLQGKFAREVI